MIDISYKFDRKTFENYYEKYLFSRRRNEIKGYLYVLFIALIIVPTVIYVTGLASSYIPTNLIAVAMGLEFVIGCISIIFYIVKIISHIRKLYYDQKAIQNWCRDLEKVNSFRLILNSEKMIFHTDEKIEGFAWSVFDSYLIIPELIQLLGRDNNNFSIACASVGINNFEKIKDIVMNKVKIGTNNT